MIHALMAALLLCAMLTVGIHDWQNISAGRERIGGAHSSEAVAVYRFIQNNTPKSAIFASVKPRSLFLNTNRMGFRPKVNQHDPLTADYWLLKSEEENALFDLEENLPKLELEFQAGDIRLYKVID